MTQGVEYRDIPAFPGYRIGSDGSVLTCLEIIPQEGHGSVSVMGSVWRPKKTPINNTGRKSDTSGYLMVTLQYGPSGARREKRMSVARLVLQAFTGPCPPGMEACHNDGKPENCQHGNLRWDTRKENAKDRERHGTVMLGTRNPACKYSDETIALIRNSKASSYQLSREIGVPSPTIRSIRLGYFRKSLVTA